MVRQWLGRSALLGSLAFLATPALAAPARADVFPVTNTNDSGGGSLRSAIMLANEPTNPLADTIAISAQGVVNLSTALPTISTPMTIDGPGADVFAVLGLSSGFRIFDVTAGPTRIDDLTVVGGDLGASAQGGGIRNAAALTLERVRVSGNSVGAMGQGAGIFNAAAGDLMLVDSTVDGNFGPLTIGASGIGSEGDLTLRRSTVNRNQGDHAIAVNSGAEATIENSTISDHEDGAGLVARDAGTVARLRSSTVAGNGDFTFGSLVASTDATIRLQNSIVADPGGGNPNCLVLAGGMGTAGFVSEGHNLADDASCSLAGVGDQPSTEPGLGPLAANGGPTQTRAIAESSPAADRGSSGGLTTDQRGSSRPFDLFAIPGGPGSDGSDVGAFEILGAAPPVPSSTAKCKGKTATLAGKGGVLNGTPRADVIVGSARRDLIKAGGGKDLVCARGGRDRIRGGGGRDTLLGEGGRDALLGEGGRDKLRGGSGKDRLLGGPGDDACSGGPGADRTGGC